MVKTAWDRLLVSFMLVAATVLSGSGEKTSVATGRGEIWGGSPDVGVSPVCPPNQPGLVAAVHEVSNVLEGGDGQARQVLDVGAHQGVLPHPQPPPAFGVQQIPHPLAVDLHVAHLENGGHTPSKW